MRCFDGPLRRASAPVSMLKVVACQSEPFFQGMIEGRILSQTFWSLNSKIPNEHYASLVMLLHYDFSSCSPGLQITKLLTEDSIYMPSWCNKRKIIRQSNLPQWAYTDFMPVGDTNLPSKASYIYEISKSEESTSKYKSLNIDELTSSGFGLLLSKLCVSLIGRRLWRSVRFLMWELKTHWRMSGVWGRDTHRWAFGCGEALLFAEKRKKKHVLLCLLALGVVT